MREHSQYTDDEFEHNGEGLAADACDDAAALINELLTALQSIDHAFSHYVEGDPSEDEVEALEMARAAIAKATTNS